MSTLRVLIASFCVFGIVDAAKRNDLCTTPDDRAGICAAVDLCEDMVTAVSTRVNRTAIEYAQKAQCGYDTVPLVCCAFIFDDHNEIFPNPPPSTATKKKDESCTTLDAKQGTCTTLNLCEDLLKPLSSRINRTAIEYAKNSQCGFDEKPLVCCEVIVVDFLNIFATPAPIPATTRKPKPTYNPQQQQLILENFKINSLPDRTVCGLHRETDRIYGGEVTEMDEFPWMGAIEYISTTSNQSEGIKCGSTIINNRFVLTAAHCIISLKGLQPIRVWLGDWDTSIDPDCRTIVGIEECNDKVVKLNIHETIPHPYYSKEQKTNDIGLIRLASNIKYSEFIRPICLPPRNLPNPTVNTLMTVSGWGTIEDGHTSDIKLKVQVPLLVNRKCSEKIKKRIVPNQLCAGGVEGKDACKGDSGGPLMRIYTDEANSLDQWYQEGVVSYGVGCGVHDVPAVYTRVSRFIKWIEDSIKESEQR